MIKEITFSMGQTLQLEQFKPTNIHYSAKAEVVIPGKLRNLVNKIRGVEIEENDAVQKEYDKLEQVVSDRLRGKILEVTNNHKKKEARKRKEMAERVNDTEIKIVDEK